MTDDLKAPLPAIAIVLLAIVISTATLLAAPQRPAVIRPAQPMERVDPPGQPSAAELAELKQTYDTLSPDEQAAMVAMYADLGIDLVKLFGAEAAPHAMGAPALPATSLAGAVKQLDFARSPQKVLDARAQLGFEPRPMPDASAEPEELAQWLHQHVLAGDWSALATFLRERAGDDAEAIYSHVLQSTNQGDPGLLPEEILAIAEATPGVPTDWQIDLLARLLKTSAAKASTGPLLERIRGGTRLFGAEDAERRQRTGRFLSKAGLAVEAVEFLPPLEEARRTGDASILLAHARYHASRAEAVRAGAQAEAHRRAAWQLFALVALSESAELDDRRQSLELAVDMLPSVPRQAATEWLREVFANPAIASAALEAIALEAMAIGDQKVAVEQRAQAILTMKEAVDTLLEDRRVQIDQLRIPLRMLTLSLVAAAEEVIGKQAPQRAVSNETALLLRALPGERWRAQIESSLAVRAYRAFIGLAVVSDDMDLALDLLAQGVDRSPGQGAELADEFLRLWMLRLRPPSQSNSNRRMFVIGGEYRESGLFTRGRQRRNLDVLDRLLDVFDGIDVDGRKLARVVDVFAACHDSTEAFGRADIERVLGGLDELDPVVAARMADTMRRGLSGEWRDAQAQRDRGIKRSQTEIDELVEGGYELAIALIDVAIRREPESWRYAMTRLSLAFDRMQFRRETGRDPGGYAAARADVFRAFGGAAAGYRAALQRGEIRPEIDLYFAWFSIALGSSQLGDLTTENLLTDAVENAAQFELIREDILAMPPDDAQFHVGEFARRVSSVVPQLTADVKAGVMRTAARLVGDHPAGASLRQTLAIYEDLVNDEVRLHLAIDGADRVGRMPFGAVLTLRSTANIAKQLGGFESYLQNDVYVFNPRGSSERMDFRDRLQRAIERAFDGKVELLSIGFFHSMNPPAPVEVDGEAGWEEKPFAYLVLRATDESADHLPMLQLDLSVSDDSGVVVLPVRSNAVLIDAVATEAPAPRPLHDLEVRMVVDSRSLDIGEDSGVVKLEITAVGEGVVPPLDRLLDGLRSALPGYEIGEDGIEEQVMAIGGVEDGGSRLSRLLSDDEANELYVELADDGVFRLTTTRSWVATYQPTGGADGGTFTVPALADGVTGVVTAEHYVDFDLVAVDGRSVVIGPTGSPLWWILLLGAVALGGGAIFMARRGRSSSREEDEKHDLRVPDPATPLAAVLMLQRIEREFAEHFAAEDRGRLQADIARLEQAYFAADGSPDGDVREALERWVSAARSSRR